MKRGNTSSLSIVLLIVGVIVGAGIGYVYLNLINTPIINSHIDTIAQNELEIASLTSDLDDMTEENEMLQGDYDELDIESDLLIIDLSTLTTRYDALDSSYEMLQGDYDELDTESDLLGSQLSNLTTRYDTLESSYEEILSIYQIAVASLPLSAAPISSEMIALDFSWYYNGRVCTVSLSVPESMYDYYSEKDRAETNDFSVYVSHPYDDEYISTIAQKMNFIALARSYSELDKIQMVIAFVQSLPYTSDSVTTPYDEYPRYPIETLVDNGGDCEDSSILTASLLTAMNYDIILVNPPGHMAVAVKIDAYGSYYLVDDEKYFYLETTAEGWKIGEIPDDYSGASVYTYELNPIPILTQTWVASWIGTSQLEVTVIVTNQGTAIASDIYVYVAFDLSDDEYVWNNEDSAPFSLGMGNSYTVTLILNVLKDENTRLVIGVVNSEGYDVDRSYSGWFDT